MIIRENKNTEAVLTRVRIVSGLILFVYVLMHYFNHAMGLVSLGAMESVNSALKIFWRFPPMSIILYGALVAHFGSALLRVYQRRTLKMRRHEWAQLVLGLLIPLLLVVHVMGTRYASERYGINDSYAYVLIATFVFSPFSGLLNAAGLLAAWGHGIIGIHMWIRVKSWYRPIHHELGLIFAALIPTFSLAGFLSAGRGMFPLVKDGEFMGNYYDKLNLVSDEIWVWIERDTNFIRYLIIAIIVGIFVLRFIRIQLGKKDDEITIDYIDGPTVQNPIGSSLLDISNINGVPHASICGGRGRCSTCRVRIVQPTDAIEPASDSEQKVLERVNAPKDVRLACQLHPRCDMKIARLLPFDATMANSANLEPWSTGSEKIITVMFADLRDFTRTSESRLPFDVVYLINQFSQTMGKEVESHGGRIDKFLGDGFMALFGIEGSPETGAKNAIRAADAMTQALGKLNKELADDLSEPLRMGIGVHTGQVILGEMGFGSARGLTAIGDTVNTASRLEAATKTQNCVLCVSASTMSLATQNPPNHYKQEILVRGKKNKMSVYTLNEFKL